MRLSVAEARALAERAMRACGHNETEARLIADHLLDCELRGIGYGGLSRAVSIVERMRKTGDRRRLRGLAGRLADRERTLGQIENRLHGKPAVLYYPIGSSNDFEGIIDLFERKAL